jgi:hypothetical protein
MRNRRMVIAGLMAVTAVTSGATAQAQHLTPVPTANPKTVGVSLPDVLSLELAKFIVA